MEKILTQLSNPFDINNFKRLIDLYLDSKDWYNFYAKVVSFYQDRDMTGNITYVQNIDKYVTQQQNGHWMELGYFSDYFPSQHRIYINSSLSSTSKIVQEFINKCIDQNLPFLLKYITEANNRSDGIVICSNTAIYKKHIDILRQISIEHPEIIKQCGTPHLLTANLDGWMGLADENPTIMQSYTQSRLTIFDVAIKKFLLKHRELSNKINGFDSIVKEYENCKSAISQRIKQGTIVEKESEAFNKLLSNSLAISHTPLNISPELIKQNEDFIKEIYHIFLQECQLYGIDINMPIANQGSIQNLLKSDNTLSSNINIDNKSPINMLNEYFASPQKNLSIENQVQLLRAIGTGFDNNILLMDFMLQELYFFADNGLIDPNIIKQFSNQPISNEIMSLPSLRSMLYANGKSLSEDEALDIINNRIKQICLFFSRPIESIDEINNSINILQHMLNNLKVSNPYLSQKTGDIFNNQIDFLNYLMQNRDSLSVQFQAISSFLNEKKCTTDELEILLNASKPKKVIVGYESDKLDEDAWNPFEPDDVSTSKIPIYELEKIPHVDDVQKTRLHEILSSYLLQSPKLFTSRDVGEASYDADFALCIEADKLILNLQRSQGNDRDK